MRGEPVPPGVTFLDHTADVGLGVAAPTLAELFTRSAGGMACLIHGGDRAGDTRRAGAEAAADQAAVRRPEPGEPRALQRRVMLSADSPSDLLRAWLREILHWHEAEGLALAEARFDALTETGLEATVTLSPDSLEPIREIKGVTLHGLEVERTEDGWAGRVIFDV